MIKCEAEGSRKSRRMSPISEAFLGRSMSEDWSQLEASDWGEGVMPSMSEGLSRSMRRIRPVERASMRTLFATWAATKSEEIENWSCTRSTLKMGRAGSSRLCMVNGRS